MAQKIGSRKYIPWLQTQGAKAVNSSEGTDSQWTACQFATANSGDKCLVGSWVFATSPFNVSWVLFSQCIYISTFYTILYRPNNPLLVALLKFWQSPKPNVLSLCLTFSKSVL